jgi:hypothetical protein
MLTAAHPLRTHVLQNLSLITLSILLLPLSTLILLVSKFYTLLSSPQHTHPSQNDFKQRTILVTGVSMTKGLALARLFHRSGHRVIGADFTPLACGRFSVSLTKFYELRKPSAKGSGAYIQSLLDVIQAESIDLWVSCSGVASAVEDGEAKEIVEARTGCKAVQFDISTTRKLHEKDMFIDYVKSLGLNVPETHVITSKSAVLDVLAKAPIGRRYIMKTIGVVDSVRGDMTLLPKERPAETGTHLEALPISKEIPWILQEFVRGKEYCTHSLVVKGIVKAFVACPSSEMLMHYEALDSESNLSRKMLEFTTRVARESGEGFSGHLSFDFLVPETEGEVVLYPIECNPRAHTAVALFNGTEEMVDGYLSLLDEKEASKVDGPVFPKSDESYYWVGHDLIAKVLLPSYHLLLAQINPEDLLREYSEIWRHIFTWRDGTFEVCDPLPWWWLYHVYWPMKFWDCIRSGTKWSRINVSTTKMFEC